MTWRSENAYLHWDLNFDPSVIQPVASPYTDYAIPQNFNKKLRSAYIPKENVATDVSLMKFQG
jgi:hypothetical protein